MRQMTASMSQNIMGITPKSVKKIMISCGARVYVKTTERNVAMALFSMIISIPLRRVCALTWVHNGLQIVIGVGTMALGCESFANSFVG